MTVEPTITSTYEAYAGPPPEIYERYFTPVIGAPCARPLVAMARLRPGERVLDAGCGTGVAARLAAEEVGKKGAVTGVDVVEGMLAVAEKVPASGAPIEWRVGPAERLPVPDSAFDAVLCSLAFQFFENKVVALQEMRRVLAPSGRVVIGTPGPTPALFRAIEDVLSEHLGPQASAFVEAVFSVHDPAEVSRLLDGAGFSEVETTTQRLRLPLPPPADFFWQYVRGTPLAMAAANLDEQARQALERDVVSHCQPFLEGEGLVMDADLLLAAGRRDRAGE